MQIKLGFPAEKKMETPFLSGAWDGVVRPAFPTELPAMMEIFEVCCVQYEATKMWQDD